MATRAKKTAPPEALPPDEDVNPDLPSWWNWDTEGNIADGEFVRAGAGYTELGSKSPFVVLTINGTERTVWAHHKAMRSKIKERIEEHGPMKPGERVVVRRNPTKRRSADGFDYYPYSIEFPDLPEPDQYNVFGAEKEAEKKDETAEQESSPADPNDDDIPFLPK